MTEPSEPDSGALSEVLAHCLRHFFHLDESNAAIHCAPVRYSPLTFRLAELVSGMDGMLDEGYAWQVMSHRGTYAEDTGR